MTTVSFHDRAALGRRYKNANGFLAADAVFARTGIQEYTAGELELEGVPASTMVRVYRAPEEVFSDRAIATYANLPVTDEHPGKNVYPENVRELAVGLTGPSVSRRDHLLVGHIVISDADAISKVENGKEELSVGYTGSLVMGAGTTPDGQPYDARIKDIRANHLAIVAAGRCGSECKIQDSKGTTMCDCDKCKQKFGDVALADDARRKMIGDMTGNVGHQLHAEIRTNDSYRDPEYAFLDSATFQHSPEHAALVTQGHIADEARQRMTDELRSGVEAG